MYANWEQGNYEENEKRRTGKRIHFKNKHSFMKGYKGGRDTETEAKTEEEKMKIIQKNLYSFVNLFFAYLSYHNQHE